MIQMIHLLIFFICRPARHTMRLSNRHRKTTLQSKQMNWVSPSFMVQSKRIMRNCTVNCYFITGIPDVIPFCHSSRCFDSTVSLVLALLLAGLFVGLN